MPLTTKRKKILFIITSALLFILLLIQEQYFVEIIKYNESRQNYDNNNNNSESINAPYVERVKISDVIAVKNFIRLAATTSSQIASSKQAATAAPAARSYDFYQYNIELSDKIGAFRALPDTRDGACLARNYFKIPAEHSKVSVIIAFHNEARSTLMRTIMSLIGRTSRKYLHELILIDDYSEDEHLLSTLQQLNILPNTLYIADNNELSSPSSPADNNNASTNNKSSHSNSKQEKHKESNITQYPYIIKMQRNSQRRLGLIESRNRGAQLATGDYLLFLDSHCEVNVGWLEPLLERLTASNHRRRASAIDIDAAKFVAVSPIVDSINAETLEYSATSKNLMGGFDWNLHFHWVPRTAYTASKQQPRQADQNKFDGVLPFKSPTFAGGIFMISRNWFFKLNAFNSLLEIWGGEAIEFSIKLWLCGGQIEIVPCSRIGHIFRKQHSFSFPSNNDNSSADAGRDGSNSRNDIFNNDAANAMDNGLATYLRNSKIIAESWLDGYKYLFYASKPAAKNIFVNISYAALTKLKRDLKCRPFAWYLQNVFTTLKLPNDDFIAFGTLSTSQLCLQILNPQRLDYSAYSKSNTDNNNGNDFSTHNRQLLMASCYHNDVTHWYLHRHNSHLLASNGDCLNVVPAATTARAADSTTWSNTVKYFTIILEQCQHGANEQRWLRRGAQLIHEQTHLCLDNPLNDVVAVSHCRHVAPTQLFRFSMEMQQL